MTEDELQDLIERVHQVEELTKTMQWAFLHDRAIKDMAKLQQSILGGGLDHETYLRRTGEYAGMARVLGLPEHMRKELDVARAQFAEEHETEEEREGVEA